MYELAIVVARGRRQKLTGEVMHNLHVVDSTGIDDTGLVKESNARLATFSQQVGSI